MDNRRLLLLCAFCTVWCGGLIQPVNSQIGARNTVPETISLCYRNSTAYNRYTRQPMHINNLISIIRKIERRDPQWDMRRTARTLVNRYMFDGIEFSFNAKPEFQYNPKSEEAIKNQMIKNYIPIQTEEMVPFGVLDNDELCALHWMLSHSMNASVRYEELNPGYPGQPFPGQGQPGGYNPGNGYNYNSNPNGNNYPGNGNSGYSAGYRRVKREEGDTWDFKSDESPSNENVDNPQEIQQQSGSAEEPPKIDEVEVDPKDDNLKPSVPVLSRFASDLQSDVDSGSPKFARQVSTNDPTKTRRPIETGVVYTRWGSISAGRLIAGIAAALQPVTIPVNSGSPYPQPGYQGSGGSYNPGSGYNPPSFPGSNGGLDPYGSNNQNNPYGGNPGSNPSYPGYPSKNQFGGRQRRQISPITFQPLQSVYAATLAGDVGQAAIWNGKNQISNVPPPRGIWNDTICPREYILDPHPLPNQEIYQDFASWTYLTEAEIRGGMDGLILGLNIARWDSARLKLSEVLEMYYSESGIVGEPQYRSCDRSSLFSGGVDANTLREQSRSFAYLFNNQSHGIPHQTVIDDPSSFIRTVDEAYQRMSGVVGNIGSGDGICTRRQSTSSSTLDTDDNLKFTEIKNRIYAVIDHTATFDEVVAQKRFLAQLAHEINVSPRGSRLGIVDGSSGMILINPNYTDNNAILACNILALPTQIKNQDNVRVLNNMKTELERLRLEEERMNYESDLGIIILFFVQGKKLEEGQKSEINRLIRDLDSQFGDATVMFTSSKYQQSDFDGFALRSEQHFIRIQGVQNISDYADEFTIEMKKKSHGRLSYTKCNSNRFSQDEEHKIATTLFVTPDTIQYYKIAPDYFYSAKNLRLRFTSDNGKVRICESRSQMLPNSRNGAHCKETTGAYVTPGNSQVDVEFSFSKPCGKNGNRNGCGPIYMSITPTSYPPPGQTGLDCTIEGCQGSNQVKVTFTHWDMRCNGAFRSMISLPVPLSMLIISLFFWKKSI